MRNKKILTRVQEENKFKTVNDFSEYEQNSKKKSPNCGNKNLKGKFTFMRKNLKFQTTLYKEKSSSNNYFSSIDLKEKSNNGTFLGKLFEKLKEKEFFRGKFMTDRKKEFQLNKTNNLYKEIRVKNGKFFSKDGGKIIKRDINEKTSNVYNESSITEFIVSDNNYEFEENKKEYGISKMENNNNNNNFDDTEKSNLISNAKSYRIEYKSEKEKISRINSSEEEYEEDDSFEDIHYIWDDFELIRRGIDIENSKNYNNQDFTIFHWFKARFESYPKENEIISNNRVIFLLKQFQNTNLESLYINALNQGKYFNDPVHYLPTSYVDCNFLKFKNYWKEQNYQKVRKTFIKINLFANRKNYLRNNEKKNFSIRTYSSDENNSSKCNKENNCLVESDFCNFDMRFKKGNLQRNNFFPLKNKFFKRLNSSKENKFVYNERNKNIEKKIYGSLTNQI